MIPKIVPTPTDASATLTPEELEAICRRSDDDNWAAYLEEIDTEVQVDGIKALVRWHRIAHDGTLNKPDINKLVKKLLKLLIDFACTRGESNAAYEAFKETGSAEGFSALQEKARNLFTKSSTTGEPGELLLYYLAERVLGCPQILCKFPHKTNPNVHAHGADGVHASVNEENGHLRLHWGEAKFKQDVTKAINECFESLAGLIHDINESPTGKEIQRGKDQDINLLRDFIDLNNPDLEEAICKYLDPDNTLSNKLSCSGIALIGFDLKTYDIMTSAIIKKEKDAVMSLTKNWAEKIKNAVVEYKLESIVIDVFCIPFSSVGDFRKTFLKALGVKNADE
jgi:hypothetical protein